MQFSTATIYPKYLLPICNAGFFSLLQIYLPVTVHCLFCKSGFLYFCRVHPLNLFDCMPCRCFTLLYLALHRLTRFSCRFPEPAGVAAAAPVQPQPSPRLPGHDPAHHTLLYQLISQHVRSSKHELNNIQLLNILVKTASDIKLSLDTFILPLFHMYMSLVITYTKKDYKTFRCPV